MDYFKKKYIKYKTKYINLQNGGAKKFMFKIDNSISPRQLINLFPSEIVNNASQIITIENESDHIRLLNLIQQNNFIVCNILTHEPFDINNYDIQALVNAEKPVTVFMIYKNISDIPRKLASSTPHSGAFASSAPYSEVFTGEKYGANPWKMDFDSSTPRSQALASSTPRSQALASSTPRSRALRDELASSTPRSRALRDDLASSTPRSRALLDELTSSTPRSRAVEYASKKHLQQYIEKKSKELGSDHWNVKLKSPPEFANLYNGVADLINQIKSKSHTELLQQLQLIIQSIQQINDLEDSQEKQKVLYDIKTNFILNSVFNDNIQRISNSVARSVSFLREIEALSRTIYEELDLAFDSEVEMDVENDEDFAFDTGLNLLFEDLVNPLNPHKVTLTNALRQIMELRNAHVYKQ